MGGPVRREELIDALPFGGGVGVVDFMVGGGSTVGVVLARDTGGVTAMPLIFVKNSGLSTFHLSMLELTRLPAWSTANLTPFSSTMG